MSMAPHPPPDADDVHAWMRLLLTPGLGRVGARKLLATFGLPSALWLHSPSAWEAVVGVKTAQLMRKPPIDLDTQTHAQLAWLQAQPDHHWLPLGHPHYPVDLLHTEDPPLVLWVSGQLPTLQSRRRLAVVGSRNPTPQGADNALAFSQAIGAMGVTIVSGLALGIDGAAHEGALRAGASTMAVVGTGVDRVYPSQHRALAQRIRQQGALVSEYPLGAPPTAHHFPERNRIIAGLTQATLVVEAALQSGSLITARMALEQGRDVLAIPGSIHSPQARGCHALIKQGAKLVESAHDVVEELGWQHAGGTAAADVPDATTPHGLMAFMGYDPIGLDALQARCGWATERLQVELLELELTGQISRLPGGLVQRRAVA